MWEGEAPYAAENRATARKVLEVLDDLPGWKVPAEAVERGLRDYKVLTGQRGRWTYLPPTASGAGVLVDCAHNIDGLSRTVGAVRDLVATTGGLLHVVFGTVSDKSVEEVLPLLPSEALFYWCAASIPRAMGAEELERRARACGFEGRPFGSVSAALDCARAEAGPHDLIWVTGSIFVVAEVLG
jgi:dihydrofolate synthase/folylpolyglutamate synthase